MKPVPVRTNEVLWLLIAAIVTVLLTDATSRSAATAEAQIATECADTPLPLIVGPVSKLTVVDANGNPTSREALYQIVGVQVFVPANSGADNQLKQRIGQTTMLLVCRQANTPLLQPKPRPQAQSQ